MTESNTIVVIGAGPAGLAAAEILPAARVIARPKATAWHAETGRIWIEDASGIASVPFTHLLLCADEPLLLHALGCMFLGDRPVVNALGATSVDGVFAAGHILGAATPEQAARQARIAASTLAALPVDGSIQVEPGTQQASVKRLDPLDIAIMLERPSGPERNRAALAQARARGGHLTGLVAPARSIGFMALAAAAPAALDPREAQQDAASLNQRHAA
jgi:succinate dehydrogenase/fumarate reductase flavoprotein subunit